MSTLFHRVSGSQPAAVRASSPRRAAARRCLQSLAALLVTAGFAAPAWSQANTANYSFSTVTDASLSDMSTGTTTLVAANQDDTASAVTPIGFDVYVMGARYDRFSVNSNGTLRLGPTIVSNTAYEPLAQNAQTLLTAYGADQRTHTTGKVHFAVTGTAPSRVLRVEWLNMQSNFNTGGTADLTYQIHVHETTGVIDYVYGAMTMSTAGAADPNSVSPQIGFSSGNVIGTVGTVTAPQSGTPAPTYGAASATPVNNAYAAGAIAVLSSTANGSRRAFSFTPPAGNPPGGPLTFTGVTATGTTLNWTDAAGEYGYAIYASADAGATFSFVAAVSANATSYAATGLTANTSYVWRVAAFTEGALASIQATQATGAASANTSTSTGVWSNPGIWSLGTVPGADDAVAIAAGTAVTIDVPAIAYSLSVAGTLQFEDTTARTLAVAKDVAVQAGGTLQSGAGGTQTAHVLSVGGNLANDGALDFSTNADAAGAAITFTGSANATFGGSGAVTDLRLLTLNKGSSNASMLELNPANFTVRGVITDSTGWLTLTNGTLRLAGTFPGVNRVFAAAAYTIPATAGFWLDNPNYAVAAQNANALNNGLLRVSQGVFQQGTTAAATLTGGVGAVFTIDGGSVNLAGRFSPASAVVYNHSSGSFNVAGVGNSGSGTTAGSFTLVAGSSFNFTGGTINLVQASTGATPIDFINGATVVASTGTLRVGTAATATNFNFRLRGQIPNLVIDNTANAKTATATAQVNLLGTTLVTAGSTFVINGQVCLVIGPTFTNNGTVTGTAGGTRFYFLGGSGPTLVNGSGVFTAPVTAFELDNVAGVTLDTELPVVATRFNNFSGGLIGSENLTLGNGGSTLAVVQLGVTGATQPVFGFDVPPVFNPGTSGVNLLYAPELTGRTSGNEVPPSRSLNLLSITNTNPITIAGGDLTVTGATAGSIALGSARVITGDNVLHLASPTATVTRTTGYVDGHLRKAFGATGSKTFEVGTTSGYSPVAFNVTAGTFPADVTAQAVGTAAPAIVPADQAITRHWNLEATDITADVTFNYLDADVPGTTTEAGLHVYRFDDGTFTDVGGTIDPALNTALVTGVTDFSPWTLAAPGATAAGNLEIAPTSLDFGSVVAGSESAAQFVTLSNTGIASLEVATIDVAVPFARNGGTCGALPITIAPGASCTVGFTFTPAGVGVASQTFGIDAGVSGSGSVQVTGTGIEGVLDITPNIVDFGGVTVGDTTAAVDVTLANTGDGALTITAITSAAAPFASGTGTCGSLPITIAAGASCTLAYTFAPTAATAASQAFEITTVASGEIGFTLNGTGLEAPVGVLTISPASIDFGDEAIGSTSDAVAVTFANTGDASLDITALTAPSAPFAVAGGTCSTTLPITLAAGASCTVAYTFAPTATGAASQVLTVTTPSEGSGSITLTGNGTEAVLVISPAVLEFGEQIVGPSGGEQQVTLSNSGTAALDVTAVTAASSPFAAVGGSCGPVPITIPAGSSCTLAFVFTPTAAGDAEQVLTVTSDAAGDGTITLRGTGTQGNLTIDPASVDFGSEPVFGVSQVEAITLGNDGDAPLDVTALSVAMAPFQRVDDGSCGNTLPIVIPAGGSCTLTYVFAPEAIGPASQAFTVTSNGTGATGFTLEGQGTPATVEIFADGFE